VGFYQNGSLIGTAQVPNLGIDGVIKVGVTWDTTGLLGDYNLSVIVDIADFAWEISEDNNTAAIQVTVLPRPTSNLTVWVLDIVTGEPLENVEVELRISGEQDPLATNITNNTGGTKFYQLDYGDYDISTIFEGYINESVSYHLSEGLDGEITIRIYPEPLLYSIIGYVFDNSTSLGVQGANLTIYHLISGATIETAVTDSEGMYILDYLFEGIYVIFAEGEGYNFNSSDIELSGPELIIGIDFRLDPIPPPPPTEGNILGIVKDGDTGEGIEGANVTVFSLSLLKLTNSLGEYEFLNLTEGNIIINISHPDYVSQENNITVVLGEVVYLNFTLSKKEAPPPPKPAIVTGNVTDQDGNPVKAASIKDSLNNTLAITDANGFFQITDLDPGTYVFKVEAKDFVTKYTSQLVIEEGDKADVVVVLEYEVEPKEEDDEEDATGFIAILVIIILLIVVTIVLLILKRKGQQKEIPHKEEEPERNSQSNGENTLEKSENE
jgi:5-hydroxyisourate hydrolase-like protein (transthyretin family)